MPRIKVRYQDGVLIPLEKTDLKEGEVLEIEIEKPLSKKLSKFVGIVKVKNKEVLEESYYKYIDERASFS